MQQIWGKKISKWPRGLDGKRSKIINSQEEKKLKVMFITLLGSLYQVLSLSEKVPQKDLLVIHCLVDGTQDDVVFGVY